MACADPLLFSLSILSRGRGSQEEHKWATLRSQARAVEGAPDTPAPHSGTGSILLSIHHPLTSHLRYYYLINSELGLHAVFLPPSPPQLFITVFLPSPPHSSLSLSKHWFTPETLAFTHVPSLVTLGPPTEHCGPHSSFCTTLPACHFLIINARDTWGLSSTTSLLVCRLSLTLEHLTGILESDGMAGREAAGW